MILFLASQDHVNMLDFLVNEEDYTIKKIAGTFSLKKFVVHDMRNFSHCKELILDRAAFNDEDNVFIDAVQEFSTMYDSRVTVICPELLEDDELLMGLVGIGVKNLVIQTNIDAFQEDIRTCLSPEGMTTYKSDINENPVYEEEKYVFTSKNIEIAVFGSQGRIGTTTAAIGLANWLSSVGAKVCYVEANKTKCLSYLIEAYEMSKEGNCYVFDGVYYGNEKPDNVEFNFVIYDFGVEIPEEPKSVNICLCGVKPYEIPYTFKVTSKLDKLGWDYTLLVTYADIEYVESYKSVFPKMILLDYQPDPFDGIINRMVFKKIIKCGKLFYDYNLIHIKLCNQFSSSRECINVAFPHRES